VPTMWFLIHRPTYWIKFLKSFSFQIDNCRLQKSQSPHPKIKKFHLQTYCWILRLERNKFSEKRKVKKMELRWNFLISLRFHAPSQDPPAPEICVLVMYSYVGVWRTIFFMFEYPGIIAPIKILSKNQHIETHQVTSLPNLQ
jgi:hypothetical protein